MYDYLLFILVVDATMIEEIIQTLEISGFPLQPYFHSPRAHFLFINLTSISFLNLLFPNGSGLWHGL